MNLNICPSNNDEVKLWREAQGAVEGERGAFREGKRENLPSQDGKIKSHLHKLCHRLSNLLAEATSRLCFVTLSWHRQNVK